MRIIGQLPRVEQQQPSEPELDDPSLDSEEAEDDPSLDSEEAEEGE